MIQMIMPLISTMASLMKTTNMRLVLVSLHGLPLLLLINPSHRIRDSVPSAVMYVLLCMHLFDGVNEFEARELCFMKLLPFPTNFSMNVHLFIDKAPHHSELSYRQG